MTFGERLAYLRNKKDLSQDEFAKILVIGKSTLGMYETNKREPNYEMTARIASFFGVSINWLITGKEFSDEKVVEISRLETLIRNMSDQYNINVINPKNREKLEKIIELVFDER
ncbi:MAG: helix-turn-helix domain-containing protein [Neobacillus sp.]